MLLVQGDLTGLLAAGGQPQRGRATGAEHDRACGLDRVQLGGCSPLPNATSNPTANPTPMTINTRAAHPIARLDNTGYRCPCPGSATAACAGGDGAVA
jgi:hypothetical protein